MLFLPENMDVKKLYNRPAFPDHNNLIIASAIDLPALNRTQTTSSAYYHQ